MRSDPVTRRPDVLDALRGVLLAERGVELDASVIEFMQWRWFVAGFDDGAHFADGGDWPTPVTYLETDVSAAIAIDLEAMVYGAGYVRIANDGSEDALLTAALDSSDGDVSWHLSTVDGDAVAGSVLVAAHSAVVLVATVIPVDPISMDALGGDLRSATLTLDPQ
jgi:hypothetical protein